MKALTYHGVHRIRYEDAPDPRLQHELDSIVEVARGGICGSDLHVYHGRETGLDAGTVMGHEFVGRVVETGAGVRRFSRGDRVACPFSTSFCTPSPRPKKASRREMSLRLRDCSGRHVRYG